MKSEFNMVIVGVGGQGTLLSSKILGYLAMHANQSVKLSEVHGMSQRGGDVITHVRIGKEVHAPMVAPGEADFLLGFEELEAVRAFPYLKEDGIVIVNKQRIMPLPVTTGAMKYPEDALSVFNKHKLEAVDAKTLAQKAGNVKAVNVVLMGMLSRYLNYSKEAWLEAIKACVPSKTLEINTKAFELGREWEDNLN